MIRLNHFGFNKNQYNRLSSIFDNAGQVVLGIVVLSPIIAGFDKINAIIVILGLLLTIGLWLISIWFSKKG